MILLFRPNFVAHRSIAKDKTGTISRWASSVCNRKGLFLVHDYHNSTSKVYGSINRTRSKCDRNSYEWSAET